MASTFDWNGARQPTPFATENDTLNAVSMMLGTLVTNRAGCALVTCGGKAVLTIAKQTADPSLEEALCRLLDGDQVPYAVKGSVLYEG